MAAADFRRLRRALASDEERRVTAAPKAAPLPVVLLCTAGRSDLQALFHLEGNRYRAVIGPGLRAAHEAWLDPAVGVILDDASPLPALHAQEARWDNGHLRPPEGEWENGNGVVHLVPAKLAPIVAALAQRGAAFRVAAAVVLSTHRRRQALPPALAEAEPVAAGPLLARWLAGRLGLAAGAASGELGPGLAGWLDYLVDDEQLDPGSGAPPATALARLEALLLAAPGWTPGVWLALSDLGGLPGEVKNYLHAAGGYRFSGRVFHWQARASGEADWQPPQDPPPGAALIYRLRGEVATLVRRGDFTAALALAQAHALGRAASERAWLAVLEQVVAYFGGLLDAATPCPAELAVLRELPAWAFPALQTEAALAADHYGPALLTTCALRDTALVHLIDRYLDLGGGRVDPLDLAVDGLDPDWCRRLGAGTAEEDALLQGDVTRPRLRLGGRRDSLWLAALAQVPELAAAAQAVAAYASVLSRREADGHSPLNYRHMLAHRALSPTDLGRAAQLLRQRGLWPRAATPAPGRAFLTRPAVAGLLHALNAGDTARHYQALIQGVLTRLDQPLAR